MGDVLAVADHVRDALATGIGVVALETSVIGQGLPPPRNEECVRRMSGAIREAGAVPGLARLRLSSIEVNHLSDDLLP